MPRLLKLGCTFAITALCLQPAKAQAPLADLAPTAAAQPATTNSIKPTPQSYISRFEMFAAPSYMTSPKLNLVQRGLNANFLINVNRWLGVGADYTDLSGRSDVVPQELTPALQNLLSASVPAGTVIAVPYKSSARAFGVGPQVHFRFLHRATFFIRPAGGMLHESITLSPDNPLTAALVGQIVPSHQKSDLTIFYGGGGGVDLNVSKHVGVRVAADFVHYRLFNDLLATGQNSVRLSLAPIFRFGGNVR